MNFRRRMVLLAAGAVAAAIVIASVVVYVVTRNELRGQIDASLRQKLTPGQAQAVQVKTEHLTSKQLAKLGKEGNGPRALLSQIGAGPAPGSSVSVTTKAPGGAPTGGPAFIGRIVSVHGRNVVVWRRLTGSGPSRGIQLQGLLPDVGAGPLSATTLPPNGPHAVKVVLPPQKLGGATGFAQLVLANGQVLGSSGSPSGLQIPFTSAARAVAAGRRGAFFSDVTIDGTPARVLNERGPQGVVWQVALPLIDMNNTLAHLKLVLAIVSLGGIALAAALGLLVSRAALAPVRRLTGAAERVARTQDLAHRIEAGERDEIGRLAGSFNTMLAALERSRQAQRQLVSDASHELRTPLTSIQANLDALALGARLPERDRARVVSAARAQLAELTVLVGDLVDLSKTEVDEAEVEDVRLDLAVTGAVERARLHAPACRFVLHAEPCLVRAAPARLDRAIANLLDNASKWNPPSPPAGPVVVRVRGGVLEVRDHGPGIAAEDLPRVFDRFYRSPEARGRPGSGLGLAIVRQTAEAHGGSVHAANDPNGGAVLTLELPPLAMSDAELGSVERVGPPASEPVQEAPRLL